MTNRKTDKKIIRSNVPLYPETREDLATLIATRPGRSMVSLINEAVTFRAALAKHEITDVRLAVSLLEELKRLHATGHTIVVESADGTNRRHLMVLGLGA